MYDVTIRSARASDLGVILEMFAQPDMDGNALSTEEALPVFRRIAESELKGEVECLRC